MGCCKFYFILSLTFFLITILYLPLERSLFSYAPGLFFFLLVVIHTRCDGNKKPILWESFYNPMVSLKSGRVLSHLIEILCEKLFKVPLHPRPISPQIPRFAFGAGRDGGRLVLRPLAVPKGLIPFPCSSLSDRFITQTCPALF